jgi:hypothetical protein
VSVKPDGSFTVEHVPPGTMRVTLMQGTVLRYVSTATREVEVREGETATVELSSRDILLSGHVTRQGIPVPRVRILVRGHTSYTASMSFGGLSVPGPSSGPERNTGITREDGGYELLLDDAGEARLSVEALDGKTTLVSRAITVPDVDAHVMDVALGGVNVTGVVIDRETEKPLPEARVDAYRRGRSGDGTGSDARTDAQGRFTLEVNPGEYRIRAAADAYNDATLDMTIGEAGASEVRLGLEKGVSIAGRVLDAQGRPAAGSRLSATPADPSGSRPPGSVAVLSDGSFRIDGLDRKPYTLLAGSSSGFAVRPGVEAGAKGLVLTLQPGGKARVQVVAADGTPATGAFVGLLEAAGSRVMSPVGGSDTDAQGVVVLDLPAGPVLLFAGKERLFAHAKATVAPGATVAVRIQLGSSPGSPRE